MKLFLHIIAKDIGHLRIGLMGYLLACLTIPIISQALPSSYDLVLMPALGLFIQAALALVIIVGSLHEDPVVGDTQFWKTRPIDRKTLFLSKVFFFMVFLILPFALAAMPSWIVGGFTIKQMGLAVLERGLLIGAFVFLTAFLASQSRDFISLIRFALAAFIILTISMQLLVYVCDEVLDLHANSTEAYFTSTLIVVLVLALVASFLAWAEMALWGRRKGSVLLMFMGSFAVAVIGFKKPFQFMDTTQLSPSIPQVKLVSSLDSINRSLERGGSARGVFEIDGLKQGQVPVIKWMGVNLETSNGLNTRVGLGLNAHSSGSFYDSLKSHFPEGTIWHGVRQGYRMNRSHSVTRPQQATASNDSAFLLDAQFDVSALGRYHGAVGIVSIPNLELEILQWKRLADVPLKKGSVPLGEGMTMTIQNIEQTVEGLNVQLKFQRPELLFSRTRESAWPYPFPTASLMYCVLYHPEHKEAFLWVIEGRFNTLGILNHQIKTIETAQIYRLSPLKARMTAKSMKEWMNGFHLQVFTQQYQGDVHSVVQYDPRWSGDEASWGAGGLNDSAILAQLIRYPIETGASVEEKVEYIQRVARQFPNHWQVSELESLREKWVDLFREDPGIILGALPFEERLHYSLVRPVLEKVVGEKDLPALIRALEQTPDLALILIQRKWLEQGSGKVLGLLRSWKRALPWEVLSVAADYARAGDYPDLARQAVRLESNHLAVFSKLKQLAGFPYEEILWEAWKRHRLGMIQAADLAVEAARLGYPGALDQAIAQLLTKVDPTARTALVDVLRALVVLPAVRGDQTFETVLMEHSGRFRFNASTRRYHLTGSE